MLDDHVTGAEGHTLQSQEDRLDVGWRNAVEGIRLQQRRHPVVGAAFTVRLQLGDLVGTGLVPRDHHIEQLAVDR